MDGDHHLDEALCGEKALHPMRTPKNRIFRQMQMVAMAFPCTLPEWCAHERFGRAHAWPFFMRLTLDNGNA